MQSFSTVKRISLVLVASALSSLTPSACNSSPETTSPASDSLITLISPLGGETFRVGDSLRIKWTVKDDPDAPNAVDPELSPDSGKTWGVLSSKSIVPLSPEWGNFAWAVGDSLLVEGYNVSLIGKPVMIRVQQYNTSEAKKISAMKSVTITAPPDPLIILTSPLGGETFHVGDSLRIKWTINDDPADPIEVVDPLISPDSGKTWLYLSVASIRITSHSWGDFVWQVTDSIYVPPLDAKLNLVGDTKCLIRVQDYTTSDPLKRSATPKTFTIAP